jgi:glycosyltransferase involved in cell wall biosynthesis
MILGWLSRAFDRAPHAGRPFASSDANSAVVRLRLGDRRRGQPGRRPQAHTADGVDRPVVIVFGVQPPPINGMSVVNAVIAEQVADRSCRVVIADISPRDASGIRYHARRVGRVLMALARIAGPLEPQRTLYAAVDSGWGILYTIAAVAVGRVCGSRLILHYHTADYVRRRRRLCMALVWFAGAKAHHVLASASMTRQFGINYPRARLFLPVHNTAFVPADPPKSRHGKRPLTLGLLSNLTRAKGLDAAINTAVALAERNCPCRLILGGPVLDPAADAAIARGRDVLGDRLELRGPISGTAKEKFFADIDVFLFATTYRHETQSLVVPEAMAHGVPVIAYAHGFVAELLDDGGGVLVDPSADFADEAIPTLETWSAYPRLLDEAGRIARERFVALRRHAEGQLTELLRLCAADTRTPDFGDNRADIADAAGER